MNCFLGGRSHLRRWSDGWGRNSRESGKSVVEFGFPLRKVLFLFENIYKLRDKLRKTAAAEEKRLEKNSEEEEGLTARVFHGERRKKGG